MPFRHLGLPVPHHRQSAPAIDPAHATQALLEQARLPDDALLARLQTLTEGLTNREAAQRYRECGSNTVAEDRRPGTWVRLAQILLHPLSVPVVHLVPGDIVLLAAANLIPADARILKANDLFVNQAPLTGESMPVEKFPGIAGEAKSPVELSNLAFMGTYVTSGNGTAAMLATGPRTFFGGLTREIGAARELTSFDRGINGYLWPIIRFLLVMVTAVFLINGLTRGNWPEALLFAIVIAVGMTPEMLPMLITVNLAKGALAMASRRVIVKRRSRTSARWTCCAPTRRAR